MLRALTLVILTFLLLTVPELQAAERKPLSMSKFQITAKAGGGKSVSDIKSADFFVTRDSGMSWKEIDPTAVKHKDGKAPYIIFKADEDGLYGFWIQVHYTDGSSEKKPEPGTEPVASNILLIDTTPPSIDTFLSGLLEGTENKLFVEWDVSDQLLGSMPVSLEHSSDLKNWTSFLSKQAKKHSQIMPLPLKPPFYVRLTAQDRAGNKQVSKVILIGSQKPQPAATATGTKTAEPTDSSNAAQLPSLDEVERDVDAAMARQQDAPKVVVPPDHQDIVAPYADKPWPRHYVDGSDPEKTTAGDERREPVTVAGTEDLPDHSGHKERMIDEEIALILKRRKGRILFGKDAERVLAAARHAVIDDREDRALYLYSCLKDSTVAGEALPEEIELLIKRDDLNQAMHLVNTAPPEVMNTALRVQEANLWMAKNKTSEAIRVLTGIIPDKTDEYKNARLLLAQCYIKSGKNRSARSILLQLAENEDSWGQTARSMLTKLN